MTDRPELEGMPRVGSISGPEIARPGPPQRVRDARAAFRAALPPDLVLDDREVIERRYLRNVTGLARDVPMVILPRSEDDVRLIVRLANRHCVALYPVSTGRNWGLGSKLPVQDGCAVVDLSRMSRIVEVNEEFGYAILEPGVTQLDLADHLRQHHPGLTLNFTGSFGLTSIVGNTLDRGDGLSARIHDLLGVRGILGCGDPFRAGGIWSNVGTGEPSHHTRYVAGPDLAALFSQSNFGIVTQLAFKLIHKAPRTYLLWGVVPDVQLEEAVTTLRRLAQQGVVDLQKAQLGYGNRFVHARDVRSTQEQPGWLYYLHVAGTTRVADAVARDVFESMGPLSSPGGVFDPDRDPESDLPVALHPIVKLLRGRPDTDSIQIVYRMTGTPLPEDPRDLDADAPPFGMKCVVAMVPFSSRHVRALEGIVATVRERGVAVKASIYGDGRVLVTIPFRRDDPAEAALAQRAEATLWDGLRRKGFAPYRVAIDRMHSLVERDPEFFDVVAKIKAALDPRGVVAPGRYAPLEGRDGSAPPRAK